LNTRTGESYSASCIDKRGEKKAESVKRQRKETYISRGQQKAVAMK
jgi:hypothetical protein